MYPHEGNGEPAQPNYLEPLPTTNLPQHPAAPGSPAHPPMPGAQSSYGGQQGGYNDEPGRSTGYGSQPGSTGYGSQPGEYGGRPTGHGAQGGYGDEPGRPTGYGSQPGGYGAQGGQPSGHGGYDAPPSQPATYGAQGGGYGDQPSGHSAQGGGYGDQPSGHSAQGGGYGDQPSGYGAPAGQPGTLGRLGFDGASADEDPPPSRRSALLDKPLILGDLLAAAGALVLVLASFLPFVSYDDAALVKALEGLKVSTWFTAWSGQTFMAPVTWFTILSAVGVLAIAGHRYVRGDDRTVLTFTLPQLQFVLAAFPAVTLVGYLIARKGVVFGADYAEALGKVKATAPFGTQLSLSFGGYLMLLAALVAVAGTVLNLLGIQRTVPLRRRSKPEPQSRPAPRTDSPFYGAAAPTSGPGVHSGQSIHSGPGVHSAPPSNPATPGAPQWDSTRQWDSAPSWESADPGPAAYEQHTAPYEPDPLTDPSYNQQPRRQTPPGTVYGRPSGQ